MHFYTLFGYFNTTFMQQYQNTMQLGPKTRFFTRKIDQNGPKCNISSITAQNIPESDVKHIYKCISAHCWSVLTLLSCNNIRIL